MTTTMQGNTPEGLPVADGLLASRRSWAERLFGPDVFLSFALGDPPRGSAAYASDLARRLQARDISVYFSEEHLEYGDPLTATLTTALRRSRLLVVIVNAATLADPRWIEVEVEEFRKLRRRAPIVAIGLDDALGGLAQKKAPRGWHGFHEHKFLVELPGSHMASESTVGDIVAMVGRLRANLAWRVTVALVIAGLLMLAALAWSLKLLADDARHGAELQRTAGAMALVAAEQETGAYAAAADRAASEPGVPPTFVAQARQATHEVELVLRADRLPAGVDVFDVDWLDVLGADSHRQLLMYGWYSGTSSYRTAGAGLFRHCETGEKAPQIRVSPDQSFFSTLYSSGAPSLLATADCSVATPALRGLQQSLSLTRGREPPRDLLPLRHGRVLSAWSDGRVLLHAADGSESLQAKTGAGILLVIGDREGKRFATLDDRFMLRLFDRRGRRLGEALPLKPDAPLRALPAPWEAVLQADTGVATPQTWRFETASRAGVLALFPPRSASGASSKARGRKLKAAPSIDSNAVSAFLSLGQAKADTVLDAKAWTNPGDGCRYLATLTATAYLVDAVDSRCRHDPDARRHTILLPKLDASATIYRGGYPAASFCGDGLDAVLGTWDGGTVWLRYTTLNGAWDPRLEIEHVERSWSDAVTALRCTADGSIYAGFRVSGVKRFVRPWQTTQSHPPHRAIEHPLKRPEDDIEWPISSLLGPATLAVRPTVGTVEVVRAGTIVWRRTLAHPVPYRTGLHEDYIAAVLRDESRARLWVLTSFGRLSLVEQHTGALLARVVTDFYAARPASYLDLESPRLTARGGISFAYTRNEQRYEISVDPNPRHPATAAAPN